MHQMGRANNKIKGIAGCKGFCFFLNLCHQSQLHTDTHFYLGSILETPVEAMIEQAIAQGRKYFYLTDHHDLDYPIGEDGRDFILPLEHYTTCLEQLRAQYASQIEVRIGVELGLMESLIETSCIDFNAFTVIN